MSENNLSRPFIKFGNPLKPKPVFYNIDPVVVTKNYLSERPVYKQQTYENLKKFFNNIKLIEKYGKNPSKKELKQFNEYLNSDLYLNEFNTYILNENKKYFDSLKEYHKNLLDKLEKYYPKYETESVYIDPVTYWDNKRIEHMGEGKTSDDVKKLQEKLGLLNISGYFDDETINAVKEFLKKNNLPVTGIWDEKTQAAYDDYLKKIQNNQSSEEDSSPLIKNSLYDDLTQSLHTRAKPVEGPIARQYRAQNNFNKFQYDLMQSFYTHDQNNSNKPQYNLNHKYIPIVQYIPLYQEGKYDLSFSSESIPDEKIREDYNKRIKNHGNRYAITSKQKGGKMNKIKYFQQGGAAPQQQDIQQKIILLVQAAMQGDQQATQTIQQVMLAAEQGDQQAQQIAQMIQQVAEQMKGLATMAKWGSKLGYIKSLKYAKGGKTCKNEKGNNLKKVKKCQTGEVIESNSPNLNYVQNGDYWYEQDGNGIIYNDTYSDVPGTLTREVETGNMINDPNSKRTYYTILGPNKNYGFVTRQGRQDRRRARNEITGGRNEITDFEQKYNNGQDITRRQLRDDDFLKNLSEVQYNNSNDADLAANVVYPQRRDIELGNLEVLKKWGRKKVFGPHIHDSACGHKELHLFDTKYGNKIGLKWNSGYNRVHNNRVKSNIEYDQMPEMKTQYAVPVQTTVEEVTETRPISNSRTTSTPNPPIEVVTPVRRTNRSATRPATRSTPVESKPIITRVPQPDTTNTTSNDTTWIKTNSIRRFPNGSYIVEKQGEWVEQ